MGEWFLRYCTKTRRYRFYPELAVEQYIVRAKSSGPDTGTSESPFGETLYYLPQLYFPRRARRFVSLMGRAMQWLQDILKPAGLGHYIAIDEDNQVTSRFPGCRVFKHVVGRSRYGNQRESNIL